MDPEIDMETDPEMDPETDPEILQTFILALRLSVLLIGATVVTKTICPILKSA
jgi:hypothetical protein